MLKAKVIIGNTEKPVVSKKAKSPKLKAIKPIEKKKWASLTKADCVRSINTACHLSSKSVNSNASAVGVRLATKDRLVLPFVAVSTLDPAKIPVDYVTGATDAAPLKQITSVLDGSCGVFFTDIDSDQMSMIEELRPLMLSGASVGTHFIDPRLRQVIWPTEDQDSPWVALTPLQSSGLSDVLRNRLNLEADKHLNTVTGKSTIFRANAIFGIGGSNPQNVGRHVRSMQRPLVFNGPTENKDIRLAYALHYKGHLRGLAFSAPKRETLAFALWRHTQRESNGQKMPSNASIRQEEFDHIKSICQASLGAAMAARHVLEQNQDHLDGLTAPTLDPFLRALIDPELRNRNFNKIFALKLINSIERFKYKIGDNEYVISGDGELSALIAYAEEVSL